MPDVMPDVPSHTAPPKPRRPSLPQHAKGLKVGLTKILGWHLGLLGWTSRFNKYQVKVLHVTVRIRVCPNHMARRWAELISLIYY